MRSKAFWQSIIANQYAIPEEADLLSLSDELLDYLAEPDPERRDTFGYCILTRWIAVYRYHNNEQLIQMGRWLLDQLDKGIGEVHTDSVFLRSYAIAVLSLIVYRDVKEHFMSKRDLSTVLDAANMYLLYERDLRTYDAQKGWINAIANVTTLLRYIVMNDSVSKEQLQSVLDVLSQKVCQPVEQPFFHDEEDRFARVVIPMMMRPELSRLEYTEWLATFKLWLTTHETDGQYNEAYNCTHQNIKHFLRALHTQMLLAHRLSDAASNAQVDVLDVIREFSL